MASRTRQIQRDYAGQLLLSELLLGGLMMRCRREPGVGDKLRCGRLDTVAGQDRSVRLALHDVLIAARNCYV